MNKQTTLYYIHDPMCSWCWAFRPTWGKLVEMLSEHLEIKYILGGLATDSNTPMPPTMQINIRHIWQTIQQQVQGTEFNFDFWIKCQPRRSTYPACRAVIAARNQGSGYEKKMILAIQQAYYLQAKNPSNNQLLIDLAQTLGLDISRFKIDLNASKTQLQLEIEIAYSQELGAPGFPSLILLKEGCLRLIKFDYNDPYPALKEIIRAY